MFNQGIISFGGGGGSGGVTDINGGTGSITFAGVSGIFVDRQGSTVYVGHSGSYTDVEYIDFNTTPTLPGHQEGRVHWDDTDKTLELDTEVVGTHISVGQEMVLRATNKTGATLTNGTLVYIDGAQGIRPTIQKASATDGSTGEGQVMGWVAHDIADNATGYVTTFGLVRDIPTSGFTAGDSLYLSTTSGVYTNVAPVAPDHSIHVGYVIVVNATEGVVLAHIDDGFQTYQLHDVDETPPSASGTILVWNGTKYIVGSLANVAGGSQPRNTQPITADYSVAAADRTLLVDASAGQVVVTLLGASAASGVPLDVKKIDSSANQVIVSGAQNIDGALTAPLTSQYEGITVLSDNSQYWII
jgi:hypothetical protein